MQPEPPAFSETTNPENTTERTPSQSSQHGLQHYDRAVDLPPTDESAGADTTSAREQRELDAALAASLQERSGRQPSEPRRLSTRNMPSPPARNRVAEYEKSIHTPPAKHREGLPFQVIEKHRNPGDKRSPIQDLPNGSCIHVCCKYLD